YVSGEKLLQTLLPKKNYVVHYRALQLYMKYGLKITKIHGALKVRQSPWMKAYIEKNIRKHMRLERLRSDQDKKLTRLVSSPLFVGFKAFEGGITAVHMLKSTVTL